MARETTRKGRVRQVTVWLRETFPCAYPVEVRVIPYIPLGRKDQSTAYAYEVHTGDRADCSRRGKKFHIRLSLKGCPTVFDMIDALLHEWAHARSWRHEVLERRKKDTDHDSEFWLTYGEIYRRWYEQDGDKEASHF